MNNNTKNICYTFHFHDLECILNHFVAELVPEGVGPHLN